jgi:hypothetical protein
VLIRKNELYNPNHLVRGKKRSSATSNSTIGKIQASIALFLPMSGDLKSTNLKLVNSWNLLSAVYTKRKIKRPQINCKTLPVFFGVIKGDWLRNKCSDKVVVKTG